MKSVQFSNQITDLDTNFYGNSMDVIVDGEDNGLEDPCEFHAIVRVDPQRNVMYIVPGEHYEKCSTCHPDEDD